MWWEYPSEILTEEKELKLKLGYAKKHLLDIRTEEDGSPDPQLIAEVEQTIFRMQNEHDDFLASLEEEYPTYYELAYQLPDIDIPRIQTLLPDSSVMLEYYVGSEQVVIFVASRDTFFQKKHSYCL